MYWPEAPALGQFRTRAFICELPAYPWPKGWTHLLWKQIIVFLTRLFKGSGIFHLKTWIAFAAQGSLPSCLVVKGGSIPSACLVFGLHSVPFSSCTLLAVCKNSEASKVVGHAWHSFLFLRTEVALKNACFSSVIAFACISMRPDFFMHVPPCLPQSTLLAFLIILLYQSKIYTHI